jgi:hypothetical protein
MLDRSLALRFKSRRGLPRVRTARLFITKRSAGVPLLARALFFPAAAAFTNALNFSGSVPIASNSATSADRFGFDLISDVLPFGQLWYGEPNAMQTPVRAP